MEHKEQIYKEKFMKETLENGGWIESIETNRPGFPDCILEEDSRLFFLEMKWFEYGDTQKRAKDFFTKYQLPWMLNYLGKREVNNLAVVFGYPDGEWIFWVRNRKNVLELAELKLIEIIRASAPISKNTFRMDGPFGS